MFERVRRADVVLAAIGLAGLAGGLMLAVGTRVGAAGWLVAGAGIAVAVTVAVQAAWAHIGLLAGRQGQQAGSLAAVLAVPVQPLADADPFRIGVFRSVLAEQASQGGAGPAGSIPPYVRRDVDRALRAALSEPALEKAGRLVVVRGDPKAGKSRTLWQALRVLGDRKLVAVARPDMAAAASDPGFAPLKTLAELDRPISRSKGRDLVIWIDDAQEHLRRGLSADVLRRLAATYQAAVIAITMHSADLDRLREVDRLLHDMLRHPFDDLVLSPLLNAGELKDARAAYPLLRGHDDLARLPELFAAVDLLVDRYRHHAADIPAGVAVARAVIDWQRAGMPPGSITEPVLRKFAALALSEIYPHRRLHDEAFRLGLDWATTEVAVFAALVRPEPSRLAQPDRFRAFDAVVAWAHRNEAPLSPAAWEFVVAHADGTDLTGIGFAALGAAQMETALDAFQRAPSDPEPAAAINALMGKSLALMGLGRIDDMDAAHRQMTILFDKVADPDSAHYAADTLADTALLLGMMGRADHALLACDLILAKFTQFADLAAAAFIVERLARMAGLLDRLGHTEAALRVYDTLIAWLGAPADPFLIALTVLILLGKSMLLGMRDRRAEAVSVIRQIGEQFGSDAGWTLDIFSPIIRRDHGTEETGAEYDGLLQGDRAEQAKAALASAGFRFGDRACTGPDLASYLKLAFQAPDNPSSIAMPDARTLADLINAHRRT